MGHDYDISSKEMKVAVIDSLVSFKTHPKYESMSTGPSK